MIINKNHNGIKLIEQKYGIKTTHYTNDSTFSTNVSTDTSLNVLKTGKKAKRKSDWF